MCAINLTRLKLLHPQLFMPSKKKMITAYIIGSLVFVFGFIGLAIELFQLFINGSSSANPISIALCIPIAIAGLKLFQTAPKWHNSSGLTPFAEKCQHIYNEIIEGKYAVKHNKEIEQFEKKDLELLIDIYQTINREQYWNRFETLSFVIAQRLK